MYVCVHVKDLPAQRAAAAKLVNNRYYSDEKKKSFKWAAVYVYVYVC